MHREDADLVPATTDLCFLNDRILPLAEARIHPLDRGFVFGDALYEALKVSNGVILHLEPHLERLAAGLARVRIPWPEGIETNCRRLVEAAALQQGSLYIQITRGVAPRAHLPPRGLTPTVLVVPASHGFDPPASRALRVITVPDWRWRNCDVKTTSLMGTVLGKLAAGDAGADEVVFAGPDGALREGGSTNLFVRNGESLETHPLDRSILSGVTRALLIDLASEEGIPVRERGPRLAERNAWSEAFICGTLTGVQPVVSIDGEPVGAGRAGEWTRRLAAAFAGYEDRAAARDTPPVIARPAR